MLRLLPVAVTAFIMVQAACTAVDPARTPDDSALGAVEVLVRGSITNRSGRAYVTCAGHYGGVYANADGRCRLALPAGRQVVTVSLRTETFAETTINVVADTVTYLCIAAPVLGCGPRLIPPEQCAVISGKITAGTSERGLPGVELIAAGTGRRACTDSRGRYRIIVPGTRQLLQGMRGGERMMLQIDTAVASGESVTANAPMHLGLRSSILGLLPHPLRARGAPFPLQDATAGDSFVRNVVEEYVEFAEGGAGEMSAAKCVAAFELLGTSHQGRWVIAYGTCSYRVFSPPTEQSPSLGATGGAWAIRLLKLNDQWEAFGPQFDEDDGIYGLFGRHPGRFPPKYDRLVWRYDMQRRLVARLEERIETWRQHVGSADSSQ